MNRVEGTTLPTLPLIVRGRARWIAVAGVLLVTAAAVPPALAAQARTRGAPAPARLQPRPRGNRPRAAGGAR